MCSPHSSSVNHHVNAHGHLHKFFHPNPVSTRLNRVSIASQPGSTRLNPAQPRLNRRHQPPTNHAQTCGFPSYLRTNQSPTTSQLKARVESDKIDRYIFEWETSRHSFRVQGVSMGGGATRKARLPHRVLPEIRCDYTQLKNKQRKQGKCRSHYQ